MHPHLWGPTVALITFVELAPEFLVSEEPAAMRACIREINKEKTLSDRDG